MKKKVTVQEIADQLGLSRNTVSKALNQHQSIAEETRKIILQKAADLGYRKLKHLPSLGEEPPAIKKTSNILAITHECFVDTSYWSIVSRGVANTLNRAGYNLIFNCIRENDEKALVIPQNVSQDYADGMLVLGSIRNDYLRELLQSGIPTVFVDTPAAELMSVCRHDTVLMENMESVCAITRFLIRHGHSRLGFIGDIQFCRSYYERWMGFKKAMDEACLDTHSHLCVTAGSPGHYQHLEEVWEPLARMESLPTAFVCANDRTAIFVMQYLKAKGVQIPTEVAVSGFDDIFEATVVEPHLTTVHVHKEEIGRRAAEQLLWRLKNPGRPMETIYIATEVIMRASTG